MNKRALHHLWVRLRPIKTWYFLAICLVFAVIAVAALRDNYTTMRALRSQVYAADKNNADVVGALNRLRSYVNNHMNTDLARDNSVYPPIQLSSTYQRLQKAEQDRVNAVAGQVYTDAQHYCEKLYPGSFSGGPRVPCIEQYVKEHVVTAKAIPEAMYKFNFATPSWSPDIAGISLVLAGLFAALTVLRFVAGRVLESLSE
jgi:hypothetical protein